MSMLAEGDIIDVPIGMRVYASVPEHFLYANRRGVFDKLAHGEVVVAEDFAHMAGRYVVFKTASDGGGTGHGPHDVYPNGHHVYCEKLDGSGHRLDFYQSGCFSVVHTDVVPVGKAERTWKEPTHDNR